MYALKLLAQVYLAKICVISSLLLHVVCVLNLAPEGFQFLVIGTSVSFFTYLLPVSVHLHLVSSSVNFYRIFSRACVCACMCTKLTHHVPSHRYDCV